MRFPVPPAQFAPVLPNVTLLFGRTILKGVYHAFLPGHQYSLCGNAIYLATSPLIGKGDSRECRRCGQARALCRKKNIPVRRGASLARKGST